MFNDNTIIAMDRIYFEPSDVCDEEIFDGIEYAMDLDRRNPVLEGISKILNLEPIDKKAIIKELNKRYREMGIEEGVPRSVKNWLDGTQINPAYRENLYNLCLALHLNIEETSTFFLKNYMTIPFN